MARVSKNITINTFHIICEGKTEQKYFETLKEILRIYNLNIECVVSKQKDPKNISKIAVELLKKNERENNFILGDKYFCVFDLDNHKQKKIDEAKKEIAGYKEIKLILSNPSLELWFLLHFKDRLNRSMTNKEVKKELGECLPSGKYSKSKIKEIIKGHLYPKIKKAIKNSKKIEEEMKSKEIEMLSEKSNPSTMIHKIIEKLLEVKNRDR